MAKFTLLDWKFVQDDKKNGAYQFALTWQKKSFLVLCKKTIEQKILLAYGEDHNQYYALWNKLKAGKFTVTDIYDKKQVAP